MTAHRDIIVIGASLGGLEALCRVTSGLPADLSAALLVVLHTGPSSPRMLAEIVGRFSPLPVSYAGQGEAVVRGHVYFASPCRRRPISFRSLGLRVTRDRSGDDRWGRGWG